MEGMEWGKGKWNDGTITKDSRMNKQIEQTTLA
jgi:hypothetical protein